MLKNKKRLLFSLFLLGVFVFTLVQKSFHVFHHEHHAEPNCTEKSSQHYHDVEHGCDLCDYTAPVSEYPQPIITAEAADSGEFVYLDFTEQVLLFLVDHVFFQRGPPMEKE